MTLLEQINDVKQTVKQHTIRPFEISEVSVSLDNETPTIHTHSGDRIGSGMQGKFVSAIGLQRTLGKKSFENPEHKWNHLRDAISKVKYPNDLAVVSDNNNNVIDIIHTNNRADVQLDYDDRIDAITNAIDESAHELHEIRWDGYGVSISTKDTVNEIDCGVGDTWQTGSNVFLGHNRQVFDSFFLRLVCTNGMTVKQKFARRNASHKNIGKQFTNYCKSNAFSDMVKQKVNRLRRVEASVGEVMSIASNLDKDFVARHMPWMGEVSEAYERTGVDVYKMDRKKASRARTQQNLYDVFNIGTAIASHHRDQLTQDQILNVNKACSDMFIKTPNLAPVDIINPFAN